MHGGYGGSNIDMTLMIALIAQKLLGNPKVPYKSWDAALWWPIVVLIVT